MKQKDWTDIPRDVHEAIRRVRRFLVCVGTTIQDEAYAEELARLGVAIDCDNEVEMLDALLARYGLPSDLLPPLDDSETEAEAIERRLTGG